MGQQGCKSRMGYPSAVVADMALLCPNEKEDLFVSGVIDDQKNGFRSIALYASRGSDYGTEMEDKLWKDGFMMYLAHQRTRASFEGDPATVLRPLDTFRNIPFTMHADGVAK